MTKGRGDLAGMEEGFADVEGVRIHSLRMGTGRPIVLVHGLTGSTTNWRRNIGALAEQAAVYALDLVNMGESGRVTGLNAGLEATADRVVAWMDAVGLEAADIAGHSHGGSIAMMLAVRHPERVRSLILFAPANPYSHLGDWLVRLYRSAPGRGFARLVPFLPRRMHLFALGRMYGDPKRIVPGSLEGYVDGLRIPGTMQHVLTILRHWFDEMSVLRGALPKLRETPALLVWGDCDRAVSLASGERLHRELARSEWVVVPGAGHVPFEEMPDACNRAMLGWLERMERLTCEGSGTLGRQSVAAGFAPARVAGEPPLEVSGRMQVEA